MKIFQRLALVLLLCAAVFVVNAQTATTTTIILVRHAEKDTIGGKDPQLSVTGRARAEKIPTLFKDAKPDLFYSTPYIRTRQTLMPWAKMAGQEIKAYDPSDLQLFANELKSLQGKTVVVAGHSNTTPVLVNLLLGANKYQVMNDSDYSKLWIVTIKDGQATDKLIEY